MVNLKLFLLGYVLTAPWIGTQWLAQHYRYAAWLGAPMLTLAGYPLYMPLRLLGWLWKYNAADPGPFTTALLVMGLWVLPWVGAAWWWQRRQGQPNTFGTQTWGTTRDLRAAGLMSDAGPVIGRHGKRYLRYKGPMQ